MPSDPNIALQIRQPEQQNPLATIGSLMNLRETQARMALQNAQLGQAQAATANIQAEAQQRLRDQKDQNTIQDLYTKGDGTRSGLALASAVSSWDGKAAFPLDGLVQPKTVDAMKSKVLEDQQKALANTTATTAQNQVKFEHIQRTLNGLLFDPADPSKAADDAAIRANANLAFDQLIRDGDLDAKNKPDTSSPEAIRNFAAVTGHAAGLNAYALANRKEQAGIAEAAGKGAASQAEAAKTAAMLPGQLTSQQTENAQHALTLAGTSATGLTADQQATTAETARHNKMQESIEARRNELMLLASRGDKSYAISTHELDQLGKPVTDAVARIARLQDTLAQNSPQADALVAPELLQALAGGMGSGLRINEAEIHRIVGGRSKWEDLQAAINKWQLDPSKANSITGEQRTEIRALVKAVSGRLLEKQGALNDAYTTVAGSQSPADHRQAILTARQKIFGADMAPAGTVNMVAPDGTVAPVPADQVEHYLSLGAKRQ